jgi:hypothetical protein
MNQKDECCWGRLEGHEQKGFSKGKRHQCGGEQDFKGVNSERDAYKDRLYQPTAGFQCQLQKIFSKK